MECCWWFCLIWCEVKSLKCYANVFVEGTTQKLVLVFAFMNQLWGICVFKNGCVMVHFSWKYVRLAHNSKDTRMQIVWMHIIYYFQNVAAHFLINCIPNILLLLLKSALFIVAVVDVFVVRLLICLCCATNLVLSAVSQANESWLLDSGGHKNADTFS